MRREFDIKSTSNDKGPGMNYSRLPWRISSCRSFIMWDILYLPYHILNTRKYFFKALKFLSKNNLIGFRIGGYGGPTIIKTSTFCISVRWAPPCLICIRGQAIDLLVEYVLSPSGCPLEGDTKFFCPRGSTPGVVREVSTKPHFYLYGLFAVPCCTCSQI